MKPNKTETKSTALAESGIGFSIAGYNNFLENIKEEFDGLDITFDRIKIPSGGVTLFEVPTDEGDETESVKEFSGVILYHHTLNAFYLSKYTGGSNPPDCGSFDGSVGIGNPGGDCKKCPHNQFGSGENGSKACKNRRRIYILRKGEIFPILLSLPTGSLKQFVRYIKQQLSKGRKLNSVVTQFGLKKVTNAGGIAYSQAVFTTDRVLTPEEYAMVEKLSAQIKTFSNQVDFDADSAAVVDDMNIDPETGEIIEPLGGTQNV